jgi:hypothetical protein
MSGGADVLVVRPLGPCDDIRLQFLLIEDSARRALEVQMVLDPNVIRPASTSLTR